MLPPSWGGPAANSAVSHQLQQEFERMRDRFDAVFKAMLNPEPRGVAETPSKAVYTEGQLRLLRYQPALRRTYPIPLCIVPSPFGRADLLDLMPGASLVECLVGRGVDVYLLDWGVPGPEDRSTTLDQYVAGYLRRAVQRVRSLSGQERISLLGYGMGGTLTAIFGALYGRYVANLVQLAAPIDFHDDSILSQWRRRERFNVDLVVDTLGAMPPALMKASFRMLKPAAQIAQQIALAEQLDDMEAVRDLLALDRWLDDTPPYLGEAYRAFIKECYQENQLVQGKLVIAGKLVDLAQVDTPLLTIVAARDRIYPPQSSRSLDSLSTSEDKQILELPCGHTSLLAGPLAAEQLWPQLADWLIARSEDGAADK